MREIKFRAWDEGNKIMHNDFKFINSGDCGNDWIIFISDKHTLSNHDTNPFINPNPYFYHQLKKMQYTGLKDKNGKEVYEGDIVTSIILSGDNKTIAISFEYGAFRIGLQPLNVQKDIEVIGNIYEHPHLLGETK